MLKSWIYICVKITFDVICINLSFLFGYMLKVGTFNIHDSQIFPYFKILFFLTVFWLIIFNLAGLYKMQINKKDRVDSVFSISFAVFSAAFFTYILVVYIYREAIYTKDIVFLGSLISIVLLNVSRWAIWNYYRKSNHANT